MILFNRMLVAFVFTLLVPTSQAFAYSLDYATSEKNLNDAYKKAKTFLSERAFGQLKKEQTAWLKRRRQECGGARDFSAENDEQKFCYIGMNYDRSIEIFGKFKDPNVYETYVGNPYYFIRSFDVNGDGTADKIVSHKRMEGDELLVYFREGGRYKLSLEGFNFSVDGGNTIDDISPNGGSGFVITTSFPTKGLFIEHSYIRFIDGRWMHTHTRFIGNSSNSSDAYIYNCVVAQYADIKDPDAEYNWMPEASEQDKQCGKIEGESSLDLWNPAYFENL